MKSYFVTIIYLAHMINKRFFRDKTAMFFTFVFPLIFLFVFGSLFNNNKNVSFKVVIMNDAKNEMSNRFVDELKKTGIAKEVQANSLEDAKQKMTRGEVDTILVLPKEFGSLNKKQQPSGQAIVYFNPSDEQTGQTFGTIIESSLTEINQQITGQKPLFSVKKQSTDTRGLSSFDYIFSGLLGFSILSLGLFGPTNSLPSLKNQGILRRLRTTPLRTSQFVLGNALNNVYIGIIAVALMFVVGVLMYQFKMQGNYLYFLVIVMLGIIMMFGFGLSIGGWAKTENQAAPLTNIVAFPMMFLSGVFFPRFLMPDWLHGFSSSLPLTPLVDGIRFIIVENKSLLDITPQLGLMTVWAIIIYIVAFRVFRWE